MHDTPAKNVSAQQYTLNSQFEELRRNVLERVDRVDLDRPLSHWALPRDRRLPYALLGHSLRQVASTSFHDLAATPGIGPKKLGSLLVLLHRALDDPRRQPATAELEPIPDACQPLRAGAFDPGAVSEMLWSEWRDTVRQHQLENETLGRLAPSLRDLPTVIWKAPLRQYLSLSLSELRALKTHGEKRVCLVLEVFFTIHELVGGAKRNHRYGILVQPSFVVSVEHWIRGALAETSDPPSLSDLRQALTLPLLNQIETDAGDVVHRLACGRLGIESEPETVREQAARMRVTRARIYQLLDTCAEIMDVRWPEGRWRFSELATRFESLGGDNERWRLFEATRLLLFPTRAEPQVREFAATRHGREQRGNGASNPARSAASTAAEP